MKILLSAALLLGALVLSSISNTPLAQEKPADKPAKDAKAKEPEKTLEELLAEVKGPDAKHTKGVDVLARIKKEALIGDEWKSKHPVTPPTVQERVWINEEVWEARNATLAIIREFNKEDLQYTKPGALRSYRWWLEERSSKELSPLFDIARAIVYVRQSFERKATKDEREILDSAETNIVEIISKKKTLNYFETPKYPGRSEEGMRDGPIYNIAPLLRMLVSAYPFDSKSETEKRRKKHGRVVKALLSTLKKYHQTKTTGLWNAGGADSVVSDILPNTKNSIFGSALIFRALYEAKEAGFKVGSAIPAKGLKFVTKTIRGAGFRVKKYYVPSEAKTSKAAEEAKKDDDKEEEPETLLAKGWNGIIPFTFLDPKNRVSENTRKLFRQYQGNRVKEMKTIRDLSGFALLITISELYGKNRATKEAKKLIWPALARLIGIIDINQQTNFIAPKGRHGPSFHLPPRFVGGNSGGISLLQISRWLGRERFGQVEVDATLRLRLIRKKKIDAQMKALGNPLGEKKKDEAEAHSAKNLAKHTGFLKAHAIQPITAREIVEEIQRKKKAVKEDYELKKKIAIRAAEARARRAKKAADRAAERKKKEAKKSD